MIMRLPFINGEEKSFINTNKKHKGTDRIQFFFSIFHQIFFSSILHNFSKVTVTNETTVLRMCTMTTTKTVTKTTIPVETKSWKLSLKLIFRSKWSQVIIAGCYMEIPEMTGHMILITTTNCKAKNIWNVPNRNQL